MLLVFKQKNSSHGELTASFRDACKLRQIMMRKTKVVYSGRMKRLCW
jgi:hypothetical protein